MLLLFIFFFIVSLLSLSSSHRITNLYKNTPTALVWQFIPPSHRTYFGMHLGLPNYPPEVPYFGIYLHSHSHTFISSKLMRGCSTAECTTIQITGRNHHPPPRAEKDKSSGQFPHVSTPPPTNLGSCRPPWFRMSINARRHKKTKKKAHKRDWDDNEGARYRYIYFYTCLWVWTRKSY